MKQRLSTWAWVVAGWLLGTTLWTDAFVLGGASARDAFSFGAVQMAVAATLGLWIWTLSGRVPWRPNTLRFLGTHLLAMSAYAFAFTASQGFVWALRDQTLAGGFRTALTSPVTGWNLLMGILIYLAVGGISYSRRTAAALQKTRDAQLAALNARLQPHFLFNALHTVGALVHADPDRADRAVDELGRLLRYALRESDDDNTLRREWEFARDYLAFEGLRLGERLRVETTVDERALDTRVPAFVLQPLIENAVRHGAGAAPAGGTVAVRIAQADGAVTIEIRNSVGDGASNGTGSGLRLLRERLALAYGERARLVTDRRGDFVAAMTLPADAA